MYFATRGSDLGSGYIRRIAPDGTLSTIAGRRWSHVASNPDYAPAGVNGDGGPATQARISEPREVEVAPDGAIYFSERSGHPNNFHAVVRRIGVDGIVSTVAGGNRNNVTEPADADLTGIPARDFELSVVFGIAAAPDGTLYLASPNQRKVFRIGTDGILTRAAGTGVFGALELDKAAVDSRIGHPTKVALGIDGGLYIRIDDECSGCSIGSEVKLLELTPDGGLVKLAGRNGSGGSPAGSDGEPAGGAYIGSSSVGLAIAPDGSVIFADGGTQLRRIAPALPGFSSDAAVVPSTDGSEVYVFNSRGRHLRTLDAVTGVVRWTFSYDEERRLAAVVDGDGNRLEIERSAAGAVTAIVAPGGQRTTLALDGSGWLQTVTNPAGEAFGVTYHAKGLLATFTRPGGRTSLYEYGPLGRLERAESATGAVQTLTRTETAERIEVAATSGEGRVTRYSVEVHPNGDRVRAVERPSGARTEVVVKPDGMRVRTEPDGTVTELQTGPDPRWGMRAPLPVSEVTRTPGGKQIKVGVTQTVELDDPQNLLSVKTLRTNILRQDSAGPSESTEIAYDGDAGTMTTRTPEGRGSVTTLDDHGRVVKVQEDDDQALAPVLLTYDERGRVTRVEQGGQHWTYAYDPQNRLLSRTDAGGAAIAYGYDTAGRVTQRTFPGGRTYGYGYKPGDGRLDSITMPSGDTYDVELDANGRLLSLDAPLPPGPYARTYDDDGLLERVEFPSGAARDPAFDAAGREQGTDYGDVADSLAYPANLDDANLLTRTPDAGAPQALGLGRDGLLPTSYASTGPAAGTYALDYGSMLRLDQSTLTSGGDAAIVRAYEYDDDGLPVKEGPFTVERGGFGSSGAVTGITDGTLTTDYALDTLNRVETKTLRTGNAVRYENDLTFDDRGRITRRVEAVGAATRTLDYTYDGAGELETVKEGATTLEEYAYDVNGNRTRRKLGGDDRTATYDGADRLTQQGARTYAHDADGFLTQRGGDTSTTARPATCSAPRSAPPRSPTATTRSGAARAGPSAAPPSSISTATPPTSSSSRRRARPAAS